MPHFTVCAHPFPITLSILVLKAQHQETRGYVSLQTEEVFRKYSSRQLKNAEGRNNAVG